MNILKKRSWELPEREATPEAVFMNRRQILAGLAGAGALMGTGLGIRPAFAEEDPSAGLYPVKRNEAFKLDRDVTPEEFTAKYNNFYEFGTGKDDPARNAHALTTDPWSVKIDGMVDNPGEFAFEDIMARMTVEERIYRFRCVEAWSMVIPWNGFELADLLEMAGVQDGAKYVAFETVLRREEMPGTRYPILDWPYVEGLRLDEAMHPLAFLATGMYGRDLPNQNGAPLRLVVPWKYGFKSIKSIASMEFVSEAPNTFWQTVAPLDYDFWSNVNPSVSYARWDQRYETPLGKNQKVNTLLYNGYAREVGDMY